MEIKCYILGDQLIHEKLMTTEQLYHYIKQLKKKSIGSFFL